MEAYTPGRVPPLGPQLKVEKRSKGDDDGRTDALDWTVWREQFVLSVQWGSDLALLGEIRSRFSTRKEAIQELGLRASGG